MIPAKLGQAGFRFIKLKIKDKTPMQRGYHTTNNYAIDDPALLQWITPIKAINPRWNGLYGNYGVLAQPDTGLIDGDNQDIVDYALCLRGLEDAFRVQSGSGRGAHIYFTTNESRTIPLLQDNENVGHIKGSPSGYCVGPGSVHPSGGIYRILHDGEIPFVSFQKVLDHFRDYIPARPEPANPCLSSGENFDIDIPIERVFCPDNPHRAGCEIKGAHPIHGSTTGSNLMINTQKNLWHCMRCGTGGGVALAIAVSHGLISCHEARPGILRGKLFSQVLDIAEEQYGWKSTRDNDVNLKDFLMRWK